MNELKVGLGFLKQLSEASNGVKWWSNNNYHILSQTNWQERNNNLAIFTRVFASLCQKIRIIVKLEYSQKMKESQWKFLLYNTTCNKPAQLDCIICQKKYNF